MRSSRRRNQNRDRERDALRARVEAEIDQIYSDYWRTAVDHPEWAIGVAYARYSTRFQESVGDQIRTLLDFAAANQILIPRKFIFYDLAVRGSTNQRDGLDQVRATLKARQASVLLLFATNRLFRKTYRTLEFVETVHNEQRSRCVFVKSGVDTNDRDRWEALLHMYAMMDQFVVRMGVAHIQAAHEGMLVRQLVFGTLPFGYVGKPIPGELTRRGKPRCEIVIDPETADIVRKIFQWYAVDRLDIIEIVRRLNATPGIPFPPKTTINRWTRQAVRTILGNSRYRALWRYGVCESVYLPKADYVRQTPRAQPLKEVMLEDLRIVDDAQWYVAAQRLAADQRRSQGRQSRDGDRLARPRLLNGLLVCPQHDQPLYVGGPHGKVMICPCCRTLPANERPLFSMLNRRLATQLLLAKLVALVSGDPALRTSASEACQRVVAERTRPDSAAKSRLQQTLREIEQAIKLTRRTAGHSEADLEQAEKEVRELQGEASGVRAELSRSAIEVKLGTGMG